MANPNQPAQPAAQNLAELVADTYNIARKDGAGINFDYDGKDSKEGSKVINLQYINDAFNKNSIRVDKKDIVKFATDLHDPASEKNTHNYEIKGMAPDGQHDLADLKEGAKIVANQLLRKAGEEGIKIADLPELKDVFKQGEEVTPEKLASVLLAAGMSNVIGQNGNLVSMAKDEVSVRDFQRLSDPNTRKLVADMGKLIFNENYATAPVETTEIHNLNSQLAKDVSKADMLQERH